MKRLTIELGEDTVRLLQVLDDRGDAEAVLHELAARVVDGVSRPGSWERPWLCQAFGYEWQDRLEPDPDAHWRQRPRRR